MQDELHSYSLQPVPHTLCSKMNNLQCTLQVCISGNGLYLQFYYNSKDIIIGVNNVLKSSVKKILLEYNSVLGGLMLALSVCLSFCLYIRATREGEYTLVHKVSVWSRGFYR